MAHNPDQFQHRGPDGKLGDAKLPPAQRASAPPPIDPDAGDLDGGPSVVEVQYIGGGSDKFYRVETNGTEVTITYGRNGTAGTTSTTDLGDPDKAAAFAAKKLKEKLTKGYRPIEGTTGTAAAVMGDVKVDASVLPMLAKVVNPDQVPALIADDRWVMQLKCLAPTTQVLTETGWMAARYVSIGDRLLSSDGRFHDVTDVIRSERDRKPLVTVTPWFAQKFTVTDDHRVMTSEGWKSASSLTKDDLLVIPKPVLDRAALDPTLVLDAGSGYIKVVDVDTEFAWFCGLWVGDGSADARHGNKIGGRISLAINRDDQNIVERLRKFVETQLGCTLNVHGGRTHMDQAYFVDMPLARWLTTNFRHHTKDGHVASNSHGKTLPMWIDGWPDDLFDSWISGYMAADGSESIDPRRPQSPPQVRATTVSSHLAGALYRQLMGRGIPVSLLDNRTVWKHKGQSKEGRAWTFSFVRSSRMRQEETRWLVPVKDVSPHRAKNGTRHTSLIDFTVAGMHDFMAGTIVHNCDGDRAVTAIRDGQVAVFNRQGQPKKTNVAAAHLAPFAGLDGDWTFDGEIVGRTYHVFDLISAPGLPAGAPFAERYERLEATLNRLGVDPGDVRLVPTAVGREAKQAMRGAAKTNRDEGVIFRRASASYDPGRRSTDLLKDKFLKEADCVVTAIHPEKQSVELSVRDSAGRLVPVGQVSTIGKGDIGVGSVVEATFLYVHNVSEPRMVQPRIARLRHDKTPDECTIDQFAHAGTNKGALSEDAPETDDEADYY